MLGLDAILIATLALFALHAIETRVAAFAPARSA